ncbi:MAG: ferredoxin--NADP reductase [Actinomycetota bacterium]|nr:ferredoxin--NADP reductase [Actinomycetota bacterium]
MGQPIQVEAVCLDHAAIFSTNRSLSGQDAEAYDSGEQAAARNTFPAALASRCFQADPSIRRVFTISNQVVIERAPGWDQPGLDQVTELIRTFFTFYHERSPEERWEQLREEHYNATIVHLRRVHPDLWVFRVRPDEPRPGFKAGQYITLGLGYWEPRIDGQQEDLTPERVARLARCSYSLSHSILDDEGNLANLSSDEMEFYVVLVRGEDGSGDLPALTPRLFCKGEGDRLYVGRKYAGRYTLAGVEPDRDVVFLATGTGEAPHNAMTLELLRGGHQGRILAACSVRYRRDLAYLEVHRELERRFPQYRYLALTTREEEDLTNKVYIQDLIRSGRLEEELEGPLDPQRVEFFLCGNPLMIGLPHWDGDRPTYPSSQGVVELLVERGFTLDRPKVRGNIHYEEFWKADEE